VAAAVAHEIRNPLASISGSIELLRSSPRTGEDDRQLMDIVLREVDRLNGLLGELLDYARPHEPSTMVVEVAALVAETLRVFSQDRSQAGASVRLVRGPGADRALIDADPARIRQLLWNLLRNAVEAMPDGGEVTVTVEARGAAVEIVVIDRGVGIAAEDLERVFEPFFTRKSHGTGLGLAIVQRVVSEHGGGIAVTSRPGEGTRVAVTLPAAGTAAPPPPAGLAQAPPAPP
jgi:two-component system, NtrC family, sensor histidine kinase PilS